MSTPLALLHPFLAVITAIIVCENDESQGCYSYGFRYAVGSSRLAMSENGTPMLRVWEVLEGE